MLEVVCFVCVCGWRALSSLSPPQHLVSRPSGQKAGTDWEIQNITISNQGEVKKNWRKYTQKIQGNVQPFKFFQRATGMILPLPINYDSHPAYSLLKLCIWSLSIITESVTAIMTWEGGLVVIAVRQAPGSYKPQFKPQFNKVELWGA